MRVITTRELSRLQEVSIETIIDKFDKQVPICFVDAKSGIMKMFKITKLGMMDSKKESITLSQLRASPRKVLSKDFDNLVISSIGAGRRGGMREPIHWWKIERSEVDL